MPAGCRLMLIRSPNYHPELAGEGIEYDWGAAKQWYRSQKLAEKRTKDKFRKLVIRRLNQVKINLRMKFSRRAGQYMLAYQTVQQARTLRPRCISLTELLKKGSLTVLQDDSY